MTVILILIVSCGVFCGCLIAIGLMVIEEFRNWRVRRMLTQVEQERATELRRWREGW